MENIDAAWLKARIAEDRGARAKFSRHTGISPDKVSKILAGTRLVQATEVPLIFSFFNGHDERDNLSEDVEKMLELFSGLPWGDRQVVLRQLRGLTTSIL